MDTRMVKIEGLDPEPQIVMIKPDSLGWPLPERILVAVYEGGVALVDAADEDATTTLTETFSEARYCLRVMMSSLPEQSEESEVRRGAVYVAEGSIPITIERGDPDG